MAAFSLLLDLAEEINRLFSKTTTVTYHFFYSFELSSKLLYVKEI